jgi:glycosyltransferase involved in cell wall biosynthesis
LLVQRMLAKHAKVIVAVTEGMASDLVLRWRLKPSQVVSILNGTDLNRFRPTESNNGCFTIGTMARLDQVKDIPSLINAFILLSKRQANSNLKLLIVGDGPQRAELALMAEKAGLNANDVFPGDSTAPEEWYRRFSVFVNCSHSEGMSNTILEAMASGVPVIAANNDGNMSWLKDGDGCLIFPKGNAIALVEKLESLMNNHDLRKSMGGRARQRAEQEFDQSKFVEKYRHMYLALLSHSDAGING